MDDITTIDHVGDFMRSQELNELYWLNIELKDLENRLNELEEIGSSKIGDGSHGNMVSNPVEKVAMKKIQLKKRIAEVMLLVLEEKEKIERFIETIPNSQLRTIVRLRNIDLMSWEAIGKFMGLDRKTVAKKYNDFIKRMEGKKIENIKSSRIDERNGAHENISEKGKRVM